MNTWIADLDGSNLIKWIPVDGSLDQPGVVARSGHLPFECRLDDVRARMRPAIAHGHHCREFRKSCRSGPLPELALP